MSSSSLPFAGSKERLGTERARFGRRCRVLRVGVAIAARFVVVVAFVVQVVVIVVVVVVVVLVARVFVRRDVAVVSLTTAAFVRSLPGKEASPSRLLLPFLDRRLDLLLPREVPPLATGTVGSGTPPFAARTVFCGQRRASRKAWAARFDANLWHRAPGTPCVCNGKTKKRGEDRIYENANANANATRSIFDFTL